MLNFLHYYLCDTVMGTYDSDNSDVGYKSVHMEDNGHYNTESKRDRSFKFKEINLFGCIFQHKME